MTTALEIITDGHRESNMIALGATPTEPQRVEGLRRLNVIISSVLGYEVGEQLIDWPVGAENVLGGMPNWTAQEWIYPPSGSRLMCNISSAQTIYLPPEPCDGARLAVQDVAGNFASANITLDGNGRLIDSAATKVLSTPRLIASWMYRADLGSWVLVEDLAIDDDMPYPVEFDDAFITMLAMRLNPRYGRSISPETGAAMERAVGTLRARYRQRVVTPADIGVLNLSVQPYNAGLGYGRPRGGRYGWMN